MELLKFSAPARIVNVSSDAHYGVDIEFENLNGEQEYKAWKAYQKSKLANVLFTYELLEKIPADITVNCLHPGFVATNFGHNNGGFFGPVLKIAQRISAINSEEGAETSIFLCSSPEVKGVSGKYFFKCQPKTSSRESRNKDTVKDYGRSARFSFNLIIRNYGDTIKPKSGAILNYSNQLFILLLTLSISMLTAKGKTRNVIFITFDGLRWEEVFLWCGQFA